MHRVLLAALAGLVVLLAAGCGTGGLAEEGSVSAGQELFAENCGSCHTMAHAGTQGTIGPSLDGSFQVLKQEDYEDSTIREVVAKQIKYPTTDPPTGAPGMPADLVKGADVDDVASYVACAAGIPPAEAEAEGCGRAAGGGTGGGGGDDPKALFGSAGCGGCHTFEAAGSVGNIGPNLDESSMSETDALKQIANGGGGMPAFKDDLKPDQIDALAKYVVESRSK